jgi:hypothetical protein
LESLAVSQLFPGREVTIAARCVQSGELIRVRMKDSEVLAVEPEAAVAHANVTMDKWGHPSWAFT